MTITSFQLEGLHLLGYTRRESEFLALVATHSGYFTAHQFKCFAHTESGSVAHAFIGKLLERKHATFRAYRSGERVYHLFARKVYQAIDRENLRTRKKHEIEYVKTRLVALDFAITHPDDPYLETEAEKINFFETEWKLDRSVLPVKLYRAHRSAEVTARYFVDRFPMFASRALTPPRVTFTYVDSGAVTLEGFATHLRGYLRLFRSLQSFEFIYISPSARLFRAAESDFQRIISGQQITGETPNLLDYFRIRSTWERKERVASADVVLLKKAESRYAGTQVDVLYDRWIKGDVSDEETIQIGQQFWHAPTAIFRAVMCGSSLKVFADPLRRQAETCPESEVRPSNRQISRTDSIEVSSQ